jgi:hypothetical protein
MKKVKVSIDDKNYPFLVFNISSSKINYLVIKNAYH